MAFRDEYSWRLPVMRTKVRMVTSMENRSETFFNQLADIREAIVAAEHIGLFEYDDVKELAKLDSMIDVLDTAYDTEKESEIRARMRREITAGDWSPEEFFEALGESSEATNIQAPLAIMGEILEAAHSGEIAEEDVEDEQDLFITSALAAMYCATDGLVAFKPQVVAAA